MSRKNDLNEKWKKAHDHLLKRDENNSLIETHWERENSFLGVCLISKLCINLYNDKGRVSSRNPDLSRGSKA